MAQQPQTNVVSGFGDLSRQQSHLSRRNSAWQTIQGISDAGACAVGLPDSFLISRRSCLQSGREIVSTRNAVQRLEQARTIAQSQDKQLIVFACTNAREAEYLADDKDERDRRYLTGVRSIEGFAVYCGGMRAAIDRASAYAAYADVVCYYASKLDFAEAELFASAIGAFFPDKQLGIGFSSHSLESQRGVEDIRRDKRLFGLGYRHYFLACAGSIVFPTFPKACLWALFDDRVRPADTVGFAEP